MASMTMLPQSRPLTYADLGRVRERSAGDGHRYELIDGSLLVTPSPSRRHQRCVVGLTVLLHSHCPEHLEVLVAPFDVVLAEDTAVQPDLLVTRRPGGDRPGGEGGDAVGVEHLYRVTLSPGPLVAP